MYVPRAFAESDLAELHASMRAHPFATLVSAAGGAPFASHLPLLLDEASGGLGTLLGHVARPNPHAAAFDDRTPALAIFHGPHAYVSPRWYAGGPNVPTWNYVAVHASGVGALVEEAERVKALLADLVRVYENAGGTAWSFESLPDDYVAGMQRGIVAFEIPIERLEGKAKLSQNRDAVDQGRTREALAATGDPLARAVAAMMAGAPPR
jgi:transcriptional regulator